MTAGAQTTTTPCTVCATTLIVDPRFVTWCPSCDWNVDPTPQPTLNWYRRRAAEASERSARQLFEQVAEHGTQSARMRTGAVRFAAALVHLLTAAMFVVGVGLLTDGLGIARPIADVFGALAVIISLFLQPYRYKRHKDRPAPLTRDGAPELFRLVDEISAELGTRGLDGIYVNRQFNASIVRRRDQGWIMSLGLSLWSVLEPQERVALIGHELGHQLNGDQRRRWLVRTASLSMNRWAYLLDPRSRVHRSRGIAAAAEILAVALMLPFALAAAGLARLLDILASRQGLSAEYYADMLGAQVAGTEASAASLEKLLLSGTCDRQVVKTVRFNKTLDPWQEVADYATSIPAGERERLRRVGRLRLPRVDSTHPPSQLRADLVRRRPYQSPKVVLTAWRAAAIQQELAGGIAAVTADLHDRYRN